MEITKAHFLNWDDGHAKKVGRRNNRKARPCFKYPGKFLEVSTGLVTKGNYMEVLKEELSPADFKATKSNRIRYAKHDLIQLPYFANDFEWKDYSPAVFRRILELDGIEYPDYLLAVCGDENLKEVSLSGKPGMMFLLSNDQRFFVQTLRKSEVKIYLEMLSNYYHHVMKYGSSPIVKLYGLHVIRPAGGVKVYFVVFGNVIPSDIDIFEHYDLKGSSKGRAENKIIIGENHP